MRTFANPLRVGVVEKYYVYAEEPVCDVSLSDGGYYVAVPMRCYGQGTLFPVKKGDSVHLYFPDGSTDLPYIVGIDYAGTLPTSSEEPASNSDYAPSLEDAILTHDGSTVSLSKYGITVDPNGSMRIQLKSGHVLRVSGGGSATDKVLRGQDFINALFVLLEDYNRRLIALETWALTVGVVPSVSVPFPNVPPTALPTTTKQSCESTKSQYVVIQ